MDTEIIRTHRGSASSDLFICLPSRFSSSSPGAATSIAPSLMKISSKSILSPGRTDKFRDPAGGPMSLSSSLSRRLRSNGSMKGGQASPMFPTGSKKRGCGFENPEPSSPKVTCIGQVRVKTKKKKQHQQQQNKQGRKVLLSSPTRSMRRSGGGGGGADVSFRRAEHHQQQENQGNDAVFGRNHTNQECLRQMNHNASSSGGGTQKWVHLPLTICEALRAFGAEFNCFLPCRSSSSCGSAANQRENDGMERVTAAAEAEERGSSCGTAFVRWLVTLQDGEGGNKGREIELVIGGDEEEEDRVEEEEEEEEEMSWRRRVRRGGGGIGEIEVWDCGKGEVLEEGKEEEKEEGTRVSVCVPPKNALLLMRCRSDPLRMSALANRLWESSVSKDGDDDDELEEENDGGECETVEEKCQLKVDKIGEGQLVREKWVSGEANGENHQNSEEEEEENLVLMEAEDAKEQTLGGNLENIELDEVNPEVEEEEAEKSPDKDSEESAAAGVFVSEDPHILDNEENESMPLFKAEEEGEKEEIHGKLEGAEKEYREEIDSSSSLVSLQCVGEEEAQEEEEAEELNNEETAKAKEEEEEEEEEECERKVEFLAKALALEAAAGADEKKETSQRASVPENQETAAHLPRSDPELQTQKTKHDGDGIATNSKERKSVERDRSCGGGGNGGLAESLLLQMMFEPKLSMEVSKETWVCSTDFIQRPRRSHPPPLPDNRPVNPIDGPDGPKKKNGTSIESRLPPPPQSLHLQPPRSSCSLPAPAAAAAAARASVSMATIIGEKLVNAVAYEPFVLTRCKSEPMRSASKLAPPDACFWKNRKLGAAGVGF